MEVKKTTITCDVAGCDSTFTAPTANPQRAAELARKDGWQVGLDDRCPNLFECGECGTEFHLIEEFDGHRKRDHRGRRCG